MKEDTIYFNPAEPVYGNREAVVRNFGRLNFSNATNKLIRLDFIRENGMQAYEVVERIATVGPVTYRHNLREGSTMRSAMTRTKLDSLLYIVQYLAGAPRDVNVELQAVTNAVYGMKHLYLSPQGRAYRKQWMTALWETGVQHMETAGAGLQPLSRLVAGAFRFRPLGARLYLSLLLWCYGIFLSFRKQREKA